MILQLTWNNYKNRFELDTSLIISNEDFEDINLKLNSVYLFFDFYNKVWYFEEKRIDEIILWFKKFKINLLIKDNAKNKIINIKNSYKKELKINRKIEFDTSILNNKYKYFNFQLEAIKFGVIRNRFYNADDAGLGKSIEVISVFITWYNNGLIDGIIISTRSTICYHWKREILKKFNIFKEEDIEIIENENKEKVFDKYKDKKILIVTRDNISSIFGSYKKDYNKTKRKKSNWRWKKYVDVCKKWNKKSVCLVLDEAHDYSNIKSTRTRSILTHKDCFDYRISLSATPAINHFEKYYISFKLLDESIFPMTYEAFKLYISKKIGNEYGLYNIKEYDSDVIENIKPVFSTYFIKRLKKDLPEVKTEQFVEPIYLQMSKQHLELYQIFIQYEIYKLEQEYNKIKPKLIFQKFPYLLQIIDNPFLLKNKIQNKELNKLLKDWDFKYDNKFLALDEKIEDSIDNKEKLIIFDIHPLTLNMLAEKYKQHNPLLLHGETKDTAKTADEKINLFNDRNNKYRLFFINPHVGGAGTSLHEGTNHSIYYNLPYNVVATRQANDRTWRVVSTEDSIVDILVSDNTIDLIRYERNINRIELNDSFLNKDLSINELKDLLCGII